VPGPLSLKADPGALLALPGSTGAEVVPQLNPAVVPGWPVVGFCCAVAVAAGTTRAAIERAVRKRTRLIAVTSNLLDNLSYPLYVRGVLSGLRRRRFIACWSACPQTTGVSEARMIRAPTRVIYRARRHVELGGHSEHLDPCALLVATLAKNALAGFG
jgi:hypothetical protein